MVEMRQPSLSFIQGYISQPHPDANIFWKYFIMTRHDRKLGDYTENTSITFTIITRQKNSIAFASQTA